MRIALDHSGVQTDRFATDAVVARRRLATPCRLRTSFLCSAAVMSNTKYSRGGPFTPLREPHNQQIFSSASQECALAWACFISRLLLAMHMRKPWVSKVTRSSKSVISVAATGLDTRTLHGAPNNTGPANLIDSLGDLRHSRVPYGLTKSWKFMGFPLHHTPQLATGVRCQTLFGYSWGLLHDEANPLTGRRAHTSNSTSPARIHMPLPLTSPPRAREPGWRDHTSPPSPS